MSYVAAPKRRRRWWIAALAIPVAFLLWGPMGWQDSPIYWALIKLPHTRDTRLVGQWRTSPSGSTTYCRAVLLTADGNGKCFHGKDGAWWPFAWGTEGGVLYTGAMIVDAFQGERHPYTLSSDGKGLTFGYGHMFLVAPTMNRQ